MTKSTITRERLGCIASWRAKYSSGHNVVLPAEEAEELARIALAAMDSKPVYQCEFCHADASGELQWHWEDVNKDFYEQYDSERRGQRRILYSAPQSAPEMTVIVERLNDSGYDYEGGEVTPQNAATVVDILLQQLNDAVQGQDAQPAPVGPVTDAMAYAFHHALTDGPLGDDDVEDIKTGLRAAFATVTINQPAPVVLTFEEWCKRTGQKPQGWVCDAMKEAYEGANSPVIPDGYVMIPMRLTAENGAKGALSGEFSEIQFVNCPECFGDDECETCDGSGRVEIKVPVSWTTIKAIWVKGVEHFATTITEE
ncbi:Uncharacterised protein [Klebsiella oxytoca]|uniref:hypothetical protein n=1 Tax=Klebsiella oxytoca TaxID=571 RepID=UPI0007CC6A13|nr:hypothetical protein [Klebsiella oxytoca]SAP48370.1 Uncharacterised protein [Klebsiella oxytoca]SAP61912.1 Uncharacterised protein [Klebsiella oxytoca]SAP66352.1 Uncharacterised protein [Klebsiella oxytoca]SAP82275.1 Uncharacterised protein [Klebsiella oxytoca]SAP82985.1 Uncharacterised protein [Klebsiella oxytoca]